MTRLLLLFSLFLLAACSSPESTLRRVPLEVRDAAEQVVDEVMQGDLSALQEANPDADAGQMQTFIERSRMAVRAGREEARNLVGARVGRGGESYYLGHEVETKAGFTVISQTWGGPRGETPRLLALEVEGSDTSLAASRRRMGMAGWLMGIGFVLGTVLTLLAFLRMRRREV